MTAEAKEIEDTEAPPDQTQEVTEEMEGDMMITSVMREIEMIGGGTSILEVEETLETERIEETPEIERIGETPEIEETGMTPERGEAGMTPEKEEMIEVVIKGTGQLTRLLPSHHQVQARIKNS